MTTKKSKLLITFGCYVGTALFAHILGALTVFFIIMFTTWARKCLFTNIALEKLVINDCLALWSCVFWSVWCSCPFNGPLNCEWRKLRFPIFCLHNLQVQVCWRHVRYSLWRICASQMQWVEASVQRRLNEVDPFISLCWLFETNLVGLRSGGLARDGAEACARCVMLNSFGKYSFLKKVGTEGYSMRLSQLYSFLGSSSSVSVRLGVQMFGRKSDSTATVPISKSLY